MFTIDEESHHATVQLKCRPFAGSRIAESVYSSLEDFCTHAILDTGASRCIIGDKTLHRLKQSLPECIRSQIRQKDSSVKFRFGNNQSLTSMYAVQLPLKHAHGRKLWLSVEVVRGLTPFLFSKKAFKMLQGSLDTQTDQCVVQSSRSAHSVANESHWFVSHRHVGHLPRRCHRIHPCGSQAVCHRPFPFTIRGKMF